MEKKPRYHTYFSIELGKINASKLKRDSTYLIANTPNVGRVAQRKKKFNQFYCLIMILGYKRNSKLLFMKKNLEPSWRYHLTHTANSAQIWQNFIAVYHQPSNMAQDFISLLPILSSFFIPKS